MLSQQTLLVEAEQQAQFIEDALIVMQCCLSAIQRPKRFYDNQISVSETLENEDEKYDLRFKREASTLSRGSHTHKNRNENHSIERKIKKQSYNHNTDQGDGGLVC